jgi:predicted HNH restriction endonuclease
MKKLPNTPKSQIKQAIDRLWLRSRERSAALKRTGYCRELCGVKQSKAQGRRVDIEVHHADGCDRAMLAELIREHLLHDPARLIPLCKACHLETHGKDTQNA